MLKALYALSGDDDFRNHLAHRFSVLAADYALGQKFSGTDLSRRMEGLLYRVLVSANPVGHLPDGFAQDCDARIDKSSVKMTTLAQKILAFDGTPVGLNG